MSNSIRLCSSNSQPRLYGKDLSGIARISALRHMGIKAAAVEVEVEEEKETLLWDQNQHDKDRNNGQLSSLKQDIISPLPAFEAT